ncbi:hypothetical protein CRYUN_Cryun38cG0040700 [Craigia yunnanensis]
MPSSPKHFHARTSPPVRSTVLILSALLIFGIVSFLFALSSFISSCGSGYRCLSSDPRTVRVLWDSTGNGNKGGAGGDDDNGRRGIKLWALLGSKPGSALPVGDGH